MKRQFRKSLSYISPLLVLLAGLYLVLPHDVCISKLVAANACVCAPTAHSSDACGCCGPDAGMLACGDHGAADEQSSDSSEPAGSFCFSISSDQSQMTGAERAHNPAPLMAVVAILPLPLEVSAGNETVFAAADQDSAIEDRLGLHRDNCVYLI